MADSESAEMYLLMTAELAEASPDAVVPVPALAEQLGISPVSTNQMCRKLQDQGLLRYRPYRGVTLTEAGQAVADRVIRRRRLWEVFLVDRLDLSLPAAREAACRLEHVTSPRLSERLADFLQQPAVCPHGKPIPPADRPAESR
jgi:DtxR family transcriptional regulator, Mn-dependent transcriptional regulator